MITVELQHPTAIGWRSTLSGQTLRQDKQFALDSDLRRRRIDPLLQSVSAELDDPTSVDQAVDFLLDTDCIGARPDQ